MNTKIVKKISISLAAAGTGALAVTMIAAIAVPVFADGNSGDSNYVNSQVNIGITGEDSSLTASSSDSVSSENSNNSGSDQNNTSDHANASTDTHNNEQNSLSDHSKGNGGQVGSADNSIGLGIARSHEASTTTDSKGLQQAADAQISGRLNFLEQLYTRIGETKFLSVTEKTTLENEIQSQITNLSTIQNSIAAATSSVTLRHDQQSVAQSNAYLRLVPRTALLAAIDRVQNIVTMMTTVSAKLQTRLSASASTTVALQNDLTDLTAHLTDAQTKATAASVEVNASTTVQTQAQTVAIFKDARAKLQAARNDLVIARQDAIAILQGLHVSVSESATTTASTTATQ